MGPSVPRRLADDGYVQDDKGDVWYLGTVGQEQVQVPFGPFNKVVSHKRGK